jgi:hypothetical protein
VGTLLELDSGELALVKSNPPDQDGGLPIVVVLASRSGGGYRAQEEVDLARRRPPAMILGTHHPSRFGIQAAKYIL